MFNFKKLIVAVVMCAVFCSTMVNAIVIRHDVPDEKYLELAKNYPSFVYYGCGGVLIASNWILTAAHCFSSIDGTDGNFERNSIFIDGKDCAVAELIPHPKSLITDIALIRLANHVNTIEPAKLYRKTDEKGQIVTLVGRGNTGNADEDLLTFDRHIRGAQNKIEGTNSYYIGLKMDRPDTALELEGVVGPSDSGGPAYIETDEGLFVAGVVSKGEATYDLYDYHARVSAHIDWIETTMQEADAQAELNGTASAGACKAIEITSVKEEVLSRYVGSYELKSSIQPSTWTLTVTLKDGKLFYSNEGQTPEELYPLSESEFYLPDQVARIVFEQQDGKTTNLKIEYLNQLLTANKVE